MPQSQPDQPIDRDPLLAFAIESSRPAQPAVDAPQDCHPATSQSDPVASASPALPHDSRAELMARIETLERLAADTTRQMATLRSEVATLVSANREIRKRLSQASTAPSKIASPARRRMSAVAGLVVGIGLGGLLWMLAPDERALVPPPAAEVTEPAAEPAIVAAAVSAMVPAAVSPPPATPDVVSQPPPRDRPARASERRVDYLGTLSIDASPAAEVFLNRKPAGRTPLRLTNLRAGSHLVWIERDGYRRFTRVVQVPADRVTRVSASLDPLATR